MRPGVASLRGASLGSVSSTLFAGARLPSAVINSQSPRYLAGRESGDRTTIDADKYKILTQVTALGNETRKWLDAVEGGIVAGTFVHIGAYYRDGSTTLFRSACLPSAVIHSQSPRHLAGRESGSRTTIDANKYKSVPQVTALGNETRKWLNAIEGGIVAGTFVHLGVHYRDGSTTLFRSAHLLGESKRIARLRAVSKEAQEALDSIERNIPRDTFTQILALALSAGIVCHSFARNVIHPLRDNKESSGHPKQDSCENTQSGPAITQTR